MTKQKTNRRLPIPVCEPGRLEVRRMQGRGSGEETPVRVGEASRGRRQADRLGQEASGCNAMPKVDRDC